MAPSSRSGPVPYSSLVAACLTLAWFTGCEEPTEAHDELVSVRVVAPEQTGEAAPRVASLASSIEFTFRDSPSEQLVSRGVATVTDARDRIVQGTIVQRDDVVTFSPVLPTAWDPDTGTLTPHPDGLQPGESYTVAVDSRHIKVDVDPVAGSESLDSHDAAVIVARFQTTDDPTAFLAGAPASAPRLIHATPEDGSQEVSPHLATDPDAQFDAPQPFQLTFDGPIHPAELDRFQLIDLDDQARPLPSIAEIDVQSLHGSVVRLSPSGPLPLGHMISVEYPSVLLGLATPPDRTLDRDPARRIATVVTVAASSRRVHDFVREDFDDVGDRGSVLALGTDVEEASWNANGSGSLTPSFSVGGPGILGRFIPFQPGTIILDTNSQQFPLPDGSTPDAPNIVITGGVFPFTSIDIPDGVTLTAVGSNPMVLQATQTCRIDGEIDLSGKEGISEFAFDSAVTSVPGGAGGAGGGRGGVGHPIIFLPGMQGDPLGLISPPFGGPGFGPHGDPNGGRGGQCGMLDHPDANGNYSTDQEISASELTNSHNNGFLIPGGGGGSMRIPGTAPKADGYGNVIVHGPGHYLVRTPAHGPGFDVLLGGQPGEPLFQDGDSDNDFLGAGGEAVTYSGGQGGGGGASALDSYYNGNWCKTDLPPGNDNLCASEFQNPPVFADSVGDSRGGGGGGGGGALVIECLGDIRIRQTAILRCEGGKGGGGESLGCGNWAGSGGGGSGGAIVLRAVGQIDVEPGAVLSVDGGKGAQSTSETGFLTSCRNMSRSNPGAGGNGGDGLIQMELLPGFNADVDEDANLSHGAWIDPNNRRNPIQLGSLSGAVSRWQDLGRAARHPDGPFLHVRGLDPQGFVPVDEHGNVRDAALADFRIDFAGVEDPARRGRYLAGLEPRADWVPPGSTIRVEFQGASAIAEGSLEVDPTSLTDWSPDPAIADGLRFVRFRVLFDLGVDGEITPTTPRASVDFLRIGVDY